MQKLSCTDEEWSSLMEKDEIAMLLDGELIAALVNLSNEN